MKNSRKLSTNPSTNASLKHSSKSPQTQTGTSTDQTLPKGTSLSKKSGKTSARSHVLKAKAASSALPSEHQVNVGLGLFSLALGATELFLTRRLEAYSGIDEKYSPLLKVFGAREITSGLGLLSGKDERAWLLSRIAGDVLDVGFLTYAFLKERDAKKKLMIAISAAAVTPVVIADVLNAVRSKPKAPALRLVN
ncbi:MAG: hypothetical protein EOP09_15475 [Proteobacteria bacterium]|nr:MAG: hypothetical protein EOP09_15475 [Pseudomonadota bacterium]